MPPILPSQPEEGEIPEISIPLVHEEPASPSIPRKHKRIKINLNKRQRISRILVPNPSIFETILEEEKYEEEIESEEEEEQVPL